MSPDLGIRTSTTGVTYTGVCDCGTWFKSASAKGKEVTYSKCKQSKKI